MFQTSNYSGMGGIHKAYRIFFSEMPESYHNIIVLNWSLRLKSDLIEQGKMKHLALPLK